MMDLDLTLSVKWILNRFSNLVLLVQFISDGTNAGLTRNLVYCAASNAGISIILARM